MLYITHTHTHTYTYYILHIHFTYYILIHITYYIYIIHYTFYILHVTYYILHIHVHMHIHLHNWLEILPGFYHTSKILQGCVVCQPARGVGSGSRPATACLTCSVDDANQAALPDRFLGDPQTVCNHCRALMVVVAKPSAFYSHLLLA